MTLTSANVRLVDQLTGPAWAIVLFALAWGTVFTSLSDVVEFADLADAAQLYFDKYN